MFGIFFSALAGMSRGDRKSLISGSGAALDKPRRAKPAKRAARKAQKAARAITRKARKGGK